MKSNTRRQNRTPGAPVTDAPPLGTDAGEAPEETETLPKDMAGGDGEEEDGGEEYGEEGGEAEEEEDYEEEEGEDSVADEAEVSLSLIHI